MRDIVFRMRCPAGNRGGNDVTTGFDTRLHESMLSAMVEAAKRGVERRREAIPIEQLKASLQERDAPRPFHQALVRSGLSIIAEFKRCSPSLGAAKTSRNLADQVRAYQRGGAAALSVLTDEEHFGGELADLRKAREVSDLPVLRKDFIVDRYQLYETAVNGADAVLLIAAVLEDEAQLRGLYGEAQMLDLDCIVEVRDSNELERALELNADIIGINNRDLHSLEVNIATTFDLMPDVPAGKTIVAESGISSRSELEELERVGVDAVLIGSALMTAEDPEALARELAGDDEATREHHVP